MAANPKGLPGLARHADVPQAHAPRAIDRRRWVAVLEAQADAEQ